MVLHDILPPPRSDTPPRSPAIAAGARIHAVSGAVPVLRRARTEDAATLWALCQEAAGVRGPADRMPLPLREALFDAPCRSWAWLAEADGVLAGAIVASTGLVLPRGGYCLAIDGVYVRPRWRRRGIGARLQAHALAMAAEMGCLRLRLPDGSELPVPSREGAQR
ncbi:GNAT family N-acetyltransferase [Pseudoxanthomonas suwonensis]|jgi:Acetyltransferases|uniref:GNAT family N-acetyltransferase n=1 Tax=Pseudoxanthomonas suwonensis TaxID=314722 RepID=UPI00138F3712|nr:GNAT family N-acetyltransferase [Pseudoxanthomonas suwonensis]